MELNQIIRKKYLLLLLILILSIFLFQKYEKRSEVKKLSDVLTNEKNTLRRIVCQLWGTESCMPFGFGDTRSLWQSNDFFRFCLDLI